MAPFRDMAPAIETLSDEYAAKDEGADQFYHVPSLVLESGLALPSVRLAYQTWGQLNGAGDNCVLVPHALTGNADLSSWWGALLGPGEAFDTSRFFIVGVNMLGSPYGSTSPLDELPAEGVPWVKPRRGTYAEPAGSRYAADFPHCTIRDNVRLQHALLTSHLGVRALHAVVGGSCGGMQALEWTIMYPHLVRRAVLLACGASQSAWQIAVGEAQRESIYRDPKFNDGMYAPDAPPSDGLSVARQNAMVWYRSPLAYDQKFGRRSQPPTPNSPHKRALEHAGAGGAGAPPSYAVEGYLDHQGTKFVDRFDANCYLTLTRTLDSHDVSRGRARGVGEVLRKIRQPVLVVGISSDVLYPVAMQRELAEQMPNATLRIVESPQGHDAFLLESEIVSQLVTEALAQPEDECVTEYPTVLSEAKQEETPPPTPLPAKRAVPPPMPATAPPPMLMPTAEVLSRISAEAIAKRKAAQREGIQTAGCLTAVSW